VAQVARALTIGPRVGLTATDLRVITAHKFAVRPILDRYPAFVVDSEGRWHLGVATAMPRGSSGEAADARAAQTPRLLRRDE